jgi:hypothetical protein
MNDIFIAYILGSNQTQLDDMVKHMIIRQETLDKERENYIKKLTNQT